jgi:hypothetical protein
MAEVEIGALTEMGWVAIYHFYELRYNTADWDARDVPDSDLGVMATVVDVLVSRAESHRSHY